MIVNNPVKPAISIIRQIYDSQFLKECDANKPPRSTNQRSGCNITDFHALIFKQDYIYR